MSEVGEIAAPLGEEAWDDTALLDVRSKWVTIPLGLWTSSCNTQRKGNPSKKRAVHLFCKEIICSSKDSNPKKKSKVSDNTWILQW